MVTRESKLGTMKCAVRGRGAVSEASRNAREFGEAEWLSEDEQARLCIIVEEILANLYDHGGLTDLQPIELSLQSEPNGIRIVIIDPTPPFDPRVPLDPGEESDRGGGAGIEIVRAWAEFVDYSASSAGNRLELLLPIGHQT